MLGERDVGIVHIAGRHNRACPRNRHLPFNSVIVKKRIRSTVGRKVSVTKTVTIVVQREAVFRVLQNYSGSGVPRMAVY